MGSGRNSDPEGTDSHESDDVELERAEERDDNATKGNPEGVPEGDTDDDA